MFKKITFLDCTFIRSVHRLHDPTLVKVEGEHWQGLRSHNFVLILKNLQILRCNYSQGIDSQNSIIILVTIFQQVFGTTFGLSSASVQETVKSEQVIQNSIIAKLTEYLYPFENCTTMLFTGKSLAWGSLNYPNFVPILLLDYDNHINSRTEHSISDKISLHQRRNQAQHCWATHLILPEKWGRFNKNNLAFMQLHCFADRNYPSENI